jgi:hypothetical protein
MTAIVLLLLLLLLLRAATSEDKTAADNDVYQCSRCLTQSLKSRAPLEAYLLLCNWRAHLSVLPCTQRYNKQTFPCIADSMLTRCADHAHEPGSSCCFRGWYGVPPVAPSRQCLGILPDLRKLQFGVQKSP